MSEPASPPPGFEVIATTAERREGKVLQTVEMHTGIRTTFTLSEEQAVVLIGQLAASLRLPGRAPRPPGRMEGMGAADDAGLSGGGRLP